MARVMQRFVQSKGLIRYLLLHAHRAEIPVRILNIPTVIWFQH